MIKSTEHFSFTVSNLNEALDFFYNLLGLSSTPVREVESKDVQNIIGMPNARLRISLVKLPDNNSIELIEYVEPKGDRIDLKTCNAGVAHMAFLVDDIQKMYEELSPKGVKFVSGPVWTPANDGKGRSASCYLRGPDGITIELIERQRT